MGWPGATREMVRPISWFGISGSSSSGSGKTDPTAQLAPAPRKIWRGIRKGIESERFSGRFCRQGKRFGMSQIFQRHIAQRIADETKPFDDARRDRHSLHVEELLPGERKIRVLPVEAGAPASHVRLHRGAEQTPVAHCLRRSGANTHHPLLPRLVKGSGCRIRGFFLRKRR
jgi:hypothetical protein